MTEMKSLTVWQTVLLMSIMWCVTGPLTMVLAAPNTELVPLQDRTQLLDSLLLEDSAAAAEQSIKASYARGRVQSG